MKSSRSVKSSLSMKKAKYPPPKKKTASSGPVHKAKAGAKGVKKPTVGEKGPVKKPKVEEKSPVKKTTGKTKTLPIKKKTKAKKENQPVEKKILRAIKSAADDSSATAEEEDEPAKKVHEDAVVKAETRAIKEEEMAPAMKRNSRARKSTGADGNNAIVEKGDESMLQAGGARREVNLAREVKEEPVVKEKAKFIKKEGKPTVAKGKARAKKSTGADGSGAMKDEGDAVADEVVPEAKATKEEQREAVVNEEANTRLIKRNPRAKKSTAAEDSGAIVEKVDEPMPLANEAKHAQPSRAQLLAARVSALATQGSDAGATVEGQTGEVARKSPMKLPRHPLDVKPKENEINIVPLKEQLLAEWSKVTHVDDAKLTQILDELSTVYLSFNVLVESKVGALLSGLIQGGLIRVPETKEKAQKLMDAWATVTKHSKPRPGARLGIFKTDARIVHEKKVALKKYEQKVSLMSSGKVDKPVASFESIQSQFAVTENEFSVAQTEEPTQA
eukprot:GEMP01021279.1.p1 GENE.GEMP01021279.1~~GEMP01021279.1.p1  ORF type:complete len:502 (-),score=151.90 GEMP01021279.1:905-2410(-)